MTHAYSETYLDEAMRNLGEAFDYAVNICGLEIDSFMRIFIASGLAESFSHGHPRVLVGLSGTELAMEAIDRTCVPIPTPTPVPRYERSEEYWAGWIIAFYQWTTGMSFKDIMGYTNMAQIRRMYHPFHEASEEKFASALNEIIKRKKEPSRLQKQRKIYGLSQSELAARSGVNLRTLQQYELKTKDINKASVSTVIAISLVLGCPIEAILEPQGRI